MQKIELPSPLPEGFLDRVFDAPTERFILPNGLTVIHRPSWNAEVISTQLWVKTGSIHEGEMLGSGLSHYLEHMLFKGSDRRSAADISREVHGFGGSINAYTSYDRTVYHIDAPAEATAQSLDVLQDLVFHARIDASECEREREVILREIDMYLDDPQDTLSRTLFKTAFRKHPYREPIIGQRALFAKVTREELMSYYRRRYVPNNCILVVVGAISTPDLKPLVETHFGELPMGCCGPEIFDPEPAQLSPRAITLSCDYQIARGCIAYRIPGLTHPQTPALDTLARALGAGESAYLWKRIRNELGLVHEIDVSNWNTGNVGLFMISFICDADKLSAAESAILETLQIVQREGLPAGVVEKSIRNAVAGEVAARKTVAGQAGRLGSAELVVGDLNYTRRYLNCLQRLTAADLITAATQFLTPNETTTVRLIPANAESTITDHLSIAPKKHGPVKQISLKHGITLLLQHDSSLPRVHLCAALRAGPFAEQAGERGSSQLLATLLTKDTVEHNAEVIAETMDSLGASLRARSGNNAILLQLEAFPFDLQATLPLFANALLRPRFDPATFTLEQRAQIAAIDEAEDELLDFAFLRFQEKFFGNHPLAVNTDGSRDDLQSMTPATIEKLHQRLVHSSNCVLSAVGDFDEAELLKQLDLLLEALPQSSTPIPPQPDLNGWSIPAGMLTLHKNREQAVVLTGYPDPGIVAAAESVRSMVLNELFSGLSSRLFETVREQQGLAYYVGATRVSGMHSGAFVFYAGTHPEQAEAVHSAIDDELNRVLSGGVEQSELDRCKIRIRAARAMSRQAIGNRALELALNKLYGEPIDDGATFNKHLDAITLSDLTNHAQTYFTPGKCVRVLAKKMQSQTNLTAE
jgi:zinc protease